eukprot:TRINITY_DN8557_c0_g1_i1.p1 TRINITY_DN8557_c0_g1~~TRINITY_DN8557_c0_g1_i1.p1  ORF type:complete len:208 (+),score=8.53 TRINITY_DN8557_c0_g1_i1:65-688(+)
MLKSIKRPFDNTVVPGQPPAPCTPHRIHSLSATPLTPQPYAFTTPSADSPTQYTSHMPFFTGTTLSPAIPESPTRPSPHHYPQIDHSLSPAPIKRIRPLHPRLLASPSIRPTSPFAAPPAPLPLDVVDNVAKIRGKANVDPIHDKIFSIHEVKAILERALKDREDQLRLEYDQILQEQLQEQFREFSKFNEDYISRAMRSGEASYIS